MCLIKFIFGFTPSFSEELLWFTFFLSFYFIAFIQNNYVSDLYLSDKFS